MSDGDVRVEALKQSFQQWDHDGDGYISVEELRTLLTALDGNNDTDELMRSFCANADQDHDGNVSYDEFIEWLFGADLSWKGSAGRDIQAFYSQRSQIYNHGVHFLAHDVGVRRLVAKSETHYGGDTKPTILFGGPWSMNLKIAKKQGEIRFGVISVSAYMEAVNGTAPGCSWYRHECVDAGVFLVAYASGGKLYHGRSKIREVDLNLTEGDQLDLKLEAYQFRISVNGDYLDGVDVRDYIKSFVPGDLVLGVQFHHTEDAVDLFESYMSSSGEQKENGWTIAYQSQLDRQSISEPEEGISLTVPSDYRKGDAKPTILFGLKDWGDQLLAKTNDGEDQYIEGVSGQTVAELSFRVIRKTREMRVGLVNLHNISMFGDKGSGKVWATCVAGYTEVAEVSGTPGLSWYKEECGQGTTSYCVAYSRHFNFYRGSEFRGTTKNIREASQLKESDVFTIRLFAYDGDRGEGNEFTRLEACYYINGEPINEAGMSTEPHLVNGTSSLRVPTASGEEVVQARYLNKLCIGIQLYAAGDSVLVLPAKPRVLAQLDEPSNEPSNEPPMDEPSNEPPMDGTDADNLRTNDRDEEVKKEVKVSQRMPPLVIDGSLGDIELPSSGFYARPVRPDGPSNERKLFAGLASLFTVEKASDLGHGRDVRDRGDYDSLKPARIWQIRSFLNCNYKMARDWMLWKSKNRKDLSLQEEENNLTKYYSEIPLARETGINEAFLLHGTRPDTVLPILANGLNERFSGGMWGQGTYLGENCEKIDQYCTMDDGTGIELHEHLYSDTYSHPGNVYYAFVCRAILGQSVHTKDGVENLGGDGQVYARTTVATSGRELATIPGSTPPEHHHSLVVELGAKVFRHREFVIFHSDLILPEFLIAYHRTKDGEVVTD